MKIELSENFKNKYGTIDWECVTIGESNAQVYQSEQLILKVQRRIAEKINLFHEKCKMEWLKGKVRVPDVIDYEMDETWEYLLMSRLNGKDAAQTRWKNEPTILVTELGRALRHLHDHIDITDCPFDVRLVHKFDAALDQLKTRTIVQTDRVNDKLLNELIGNAPEEDLVFTHGDYCLPNILIDEEEQCRVVGFVDLGCAGIADRYYDLALGLRSIQFNLGEGYSQLFLDAYGCNFDVDTKKIDFYQKLDKFL